MVWVAIPGLGRWGTETQGTHCRKGEAGHNVLLGGNMEDSSRSQPISTQLQQIAEQAVRYPEMVFTTLAHRINVDFLREAYKRTKKDKAPGIDKVTAQEYGQNLEENLRDLHDRVRTGSYVAPPVERVWIEKEDGGRRPIGKRVSKTRFSRRQSVCFWEQFMNRTFTNFPMDFGKSTANTMHCTN